MKSSAKKVELASVDDLFTTEQERQEADEERVVRIPLTQLHYFKGYPAMQTEVPFTGQPYRFKDDDPKMQETLDSVKKRGVRAPGLVRPDPDGGYEIISGHRRHRASELAGLEDMPVIIRDMTDEEAVIEMVDANIQREKVMPSEKAWAYRMKLEAIKHQGARTDLTSVQVEQKLSARDKVAKDAGEKSGIQIMRYIRLTELIPELLDMVDEKKIAFNPAYELSFLKKEEQIQLLDAMDSEQATPSLSQAQRLKKFSQEGRLSIDVMRAIMGEEKKSDLDKVTFTSDTLRKYFPKSYTPARMQETIIKLLEQWQNIEYDYLCREFATYREDLDEIVELMVETVCARRKTTRIAGSDFPHEVVRSRFLKLDSEHIRFVMDSLQKNTTEVRNMKQYLLTVLFNAPTTISNHYTSQVNHDMNAGGW